MELSFQEESNRWGIYYCDYCKAELSIIVDGKTKIEAEKELVKQFFIKFNIKMESNFDEFKFKASEDKKFSANKKNDQTITIYQNYWMMPSQIVAIFSLIQSINLPIIKVPSEEKIQISVKGKEKTYLKIEGGEKYIFDSIEEKIMGMKGEYFPHCIEEVIGFSSKTIYSFFARNIHLTSHPWDVEDFAKSYALLKVYPNWRPRMKEMKVLGERWKNLIEKWDEIEESYLMEKELCANGKITLYAFFNGKTNAMINKCNDIYYIYYC